MTLGCWLDTWFDLYVVPEKLAPSTKAMYRRAIQAVPSTLASREMEQLTSLELRRWLVAVAREYPRAAQLDRVMLTRALRIAGKLGYCQRDLMDPELVPKISHQAAEAEVLTEDQVAAYLQAARESPMLPLLMLCLCGLRRGEALGVRWEDLDGDVLTIRRQRIRIDGKYMTTKLKSTKANRRLHLPSALMSVLARWPHHIRGWIVDATPEQLYAAHCQAIQAAELPHCTLHGLRHTFATIAAAQGQPMKLLQLALGHSKMTLTADLYADHLRICSELPALVYKGVGAL